MFSSNLPAWVLKLSIIIFLGKTTYIIVTFTFLKACKFKKILCNNIHFFIIIFFIILLFYYDVLIFEKYFQFFRNIIKQKDYAFVFLILY